MFYQFAQYRMMRPGYYNVAGGNDWFWLAHFVLFMLLIIGAGIVVYKLAYGKYKFGQHVPQDPLEAAKLRYAKGEITKEEFAEIKKELHS